MRRRNLLAGLLAMARSAQAEVFEETIVFLALGICRREQLFANKNGIGSGEEAQRLRFIGER